MNFLKYFSFLKSESSDTSEHITSSIIPHSMIIWRASLLVLFLITVGTLFFDAYVFIFRVQTLEDSSLIIPGVAADVPDVSNRLIGNVRDLLDARDAVFSEPLREIATTTATTTPDS